MLIDPPPGHRASRWLVALVVVAALIAVVVVLTLAGAETWIAENATARIEEVRGWWTS